MKTISMPLEEYEKELKAARKSGFDDGFRQGVFAASTQIKERVIYPGRETQGMTDSGNQKVVNDAAKVIRQHNLSVNMIRGSV